VESKMIFLIEYDRRRGKIATFRRFRDSERDAAIRARLALELRRRTRKTAPEIVLLEAETEQALRRTHRRYFETVREIADPAG
jgi:hypothetical protein